MEVVDNSWLSKGSGTPRGCGLFSIQDTGEAAVPLKSRCVNVLLHCDAYFSETHEAFSYLVDKDANVTFRFPIPPRSAVHRLVAKFGDKTIKTKTKRKTEAVADYNSAVSQGHSAVIAKQDDDDIFEVNLGNVEACTECVVELWHVRIMDAVANTLEYIHTATWVPPYVSAMDTAAPVVPKLSSNPGYKLEYSLTVLGAERVKHITSFSHGSAISVTKESRERWTVSGAYEVRDGGKDFQLLIEMDGERVDSEEAVLQQHKGEDGTTRTYVLAKFTPRPSGGSKGGDGMCKEVWLVVDGSGSMSGSAILQAKKAAQFFVRDLPTDQGLKFNIIAFGSRYSQMFEGGAREYNATTEVQALAWIESSMHANYGGTDILSALEAVYRTPVTAGYEREVLLLTDGGVSHTQAEALYVLADSGKRGKPKADESAQKIRTRVSCLGIGHGVHRRLVEGLASRSGGCCVFVLDSEDIGVKAGKIKKAALAETIWRDPVLCSHNAILRLPSPTLTGPLLPGQPVVAVGEVVEMGGGGASLVLKAEGDGGDDMELAVPLNTGNIRQGDALSVLHAMSYITSLMSGRSALHLKSDGSPIHPRPSNDDVKEEVIRVGCAAGLVTPYTATVGLLVHSTPMDPTQTVTQEVALQLPHGRTLWNTRPDQQQRFLSGSSFLGSARMAACLQPMRSVAMGSAAMPQACRAMRMSSKNTGPQIQGFGAAPPSSGSLFSFGAPPVQQQSIQQQSIQQQSMQQQSMQQQGMQQQGFGAAPPSSGSLFSSGAPPVQQQCIQQQTFQMQCFGAASAASPPSGSLCSFGAPPVQQQCIQQQRLQQQGVGAAPPSSGNIFSFAAAPPSSGTLGSQQCAPAQPSLQLNLFSSPAPASAYHSAPAYAFGCAPASAAATLDGRGVTDPTPPDVVTQLHLLRTTDGHWLYNTNVLRLVFEKALKSGSGVAGLAEEVLHERARECKVACGAGVAGLGDEVWTTVLVLAWLHKHGGGERQVWGDMGDKAMRWLEAQWPKAAPESAVVTVMKAKAYM